MSRIKLTSSLLLFMLSLTLIAQNKRPGNSHQLPAIGVLSGRVLDSITKTPVEYANITLIRRRDSLAVAGGISAANGYFDLRGLPLGRFLVRIEFMGYQTTELENIRLSPNGSVEQDLGEVYLKPVTLEGAAVEIEAERPLMTQTIDKRIFNVSKSLAAEGNSVIEVLEQIPAVDVDIDGNISLRGSSNVRILIDGKPSGLSNADNSALLEQIPSSTIETVEIITNPSAKYDPDGMSGIINVVLKRNRLKGFTGSIGTGFADADRYNANATTNYRNKQWNVSAMLAYRTDRRDVGGTNHMVTFDSSGQVLNVLDQNSTGFRIFDSYTGRLNTEYALNRKNKLSAGLMMSKRSRNFEEDITYETGLVALDLIPLYTRLSNSDNHSQSLTYSLGWERDFDQAGENLKADLRQTINQTDETGNHQQDGLGGDTQYFQRQLTLRDDSSRTRTLQLDYTLPLGEDHKLEVGLKSIETHRDNLFSSTSQDSLGAIWLPDSSLNTHFLFDEGVYSGYVTYSRKVGLLGFQGGLRLEQARTASDIFDGEPFVNTYRSLFPSLHLSYTVAPQKDLQVSYSRRVNRPRVRALVPITNYYDPLNIRTGNPKLLPEYIDSYELNFSQFSKGISFNAGLYYHQINDLITRYKEIQEIDGHTVSISTYKNFNTGHSYGAETMVNAKLRQNLKVMLSGNITRTIIDDSGLQADINTDSYGYFFRGTATYTPLPHTAVQLFTMYRSPRQIAQGSISGFLFSNLSIKQKFWEDHGSLSLQISDLFNSRHFRYELVTDRFEQTRERNFSNRYIKLNFSYRFGKFVDRQRDRSGRDDLGMDDLGID